MICPNCKKPIPTKIDKRVIDQAVELVRKGYSVRDAERKLFADGHSISYSTIARAAQKARGR